MADANAYKTIAQGKADAEALEVRGKALQQNQSLIQLEQAQRWNGTLPTTMLPGGTVPFLNLGNEAHK